MSGGWNAVGTAQTPIKKKAGAGSLSDGGLVPRRTPHPALGTIDGYQWLIFIGSPVARQADQIREIAAQLHA